ncbi:hypothetical protein MAHJHV35_48160 [Mycobacterium avium subsp. hominissuis]
MRNLFHTRFVEDYTDEDYTDEDYTDEDYGDEPYDYAAGSGSGCAAASSNSPA